MPRPAGVNRVNKVNLVRASWSTLSILSTLSKTPAGRCHFVDPLDREEAIPGQDFIDFIDSIDFIDPAGGSPCRLFFELLKYHTNALCLVPCALFLHFLFVPLRLCAPVPTKKLFSPLCLLFIFVPSIITADSALPDRQSGLLFLTPSPLFRQGGDTGQPSTHFRYRPDMVSAEMRAATASAIFINRVAKPCQAPLKEMKSR